MEKDFELKLVQMSAKAMGLATNSIYAVKMVKGQISFNSKGLLNLQNLYGDKGNGISNRFGRCTKYNTVKSVVHWICNAYYNTAKVEGTVMYNILADKNKYSEVMKASCFVAIDENGNVNHILRFMDAIGKTKFNFATTEDPLYYAVYTAYVNWVNKAGNKNFYSAKVNKFAVDTIKCLEANENINVIYANFDGIAMDEERAKEDAETIAKKVAKLQRERDAIAAQLEAQKNKPKTTQRKTTKATQTA